MSIIEGSVTLADTGQAGTVSFIDGAIAEVLLVNGDIWRGSLHSLTPATLEMALAAIVNVDRFTEREKTGKDKVAKTVAAKKNTNWANNKDYQTDKTYGD